MEFSFIDDSNNIRKIQIDIGSKWSDIKANNEDLSSIFGEVDRNGDGVVSKSELDLLSKLLEFSDKKIKSSNNDGNIGFNEASELNQLLKNKDKQRIIDTSKPLPEDFSYIKIDTIDEDNEIFNFTKREVNFDGVDLSDLGDGRFYMRSSDIIPKDDGSYAEQLMPVELQSSSQSKYKNRWSEGINRIIDTIRITNPSNPNAYEELNKVVDELDAISEQLGFDVEFLHSDEQWLEDYAIRRADGKIYIQPQRNGNFLANGKNDEIIAHRSHISLYDQGAAFRNNTAEYLMNIPPEDVVVGKSYLEGGNVLNTITKAGEPAAVIGSESIGYTLASMGLENTPENTEKAKLQIAEDLGLKPENITYINQFDFHIDMMYRPLKDGVMAVPDYDEGLKILKETPTITGMSDKDRQELIKRVEEMKEVTELILKEAEKSLKDGGYTVQKIPFFYVVSPDSICGGSGLETSEINFLNGIGGTTKDGQTYFITNKSDYPEINKAVEEYYKNLGIDKVFFVSTTSFLLAGGGIDCLTQES